MCKAYPIRAESHQLEELSETFFHRALPKGWYAEKPRHDYGVDLQVHLVEDGRVTGPELLVQLKASSSALGDGKSEPVKLKTSVYTLLRHKLQVAMLVKFIETENEAYWLLLKDIKCPSQRQKTFTVPIPRTNKLSTAPWAEIAEHIRKVNEKKLAANE